MKIMMTFTLCFFLNGCWMGDRFPYTQEGAADIYGNTICIYSTYGDVLQYYNLTFSEDKYKTRLLDSGFEPIHLEYPDLCLKAPLKKGYRYSLLYKLNNETFRLEFNIDLNGNVTFGGY